MTLHPLLARLLASRRALNLVGFLTCAGLISFAYYAQFVLGLEPCPLCIFQRVAMIALGLVFLAATLHDPQGRGRWVWVGAVALAAGAGITIAGRHLWLQSLPPELVPACGPGLDYLLDVLPAFDVLRQVFTGSGECAKVDWTLFGLAMPGWVLIGFVGLGVAGVWNNARRL
jgi:disulfide bond formation protein DsbB